MSANFSRSVMLRGRRGRRLIPAVLALALVLLAGAAALAPMPVACDGVCQCWYCPNYHWIDGVPFCDSGCDHGCAGSCTSDGDCSQVPGRGGCGPVCSCRDSDCASGPLPTRRPPAVTATPAPTPPPGCPGLDEVREWITLAPPRLEPVTYEPDFPVVVGQDPDRQGFTLHIVGAGGRYEHKTQRNEQVCNADGQHYPDDCPGAWHYECPIRCTECYDDPFEAIQVRMRLADTTADWIQGELAARYTGARPREGLPRTWQLAGVWGEMAVDQWWTYAPRRPDVLSNGPLDPGIHGGKIAGWTTGTPQSPPQLVEKAFSVPVHLLDTTIGE